MRHNNLINLIFSERNVITICDLCDAPFDDYNAIEFAAVLESNGGDLVSHAGFRLRNQYLRPLRAQCKHS